MTSHEKIKMGHWRSPYDPPGDLTRVFTKVAFRKGNGTPAISGKSRLVKILKFGQICAVKGDGHPSLISCEI